MLPGESQEDFEQLRTAFRDTYEPFGAVEEILASRAVVALWRLRRLERVESGLLGYRINQMRLLKLERPLIDFNLDSYVPTATQKEHALIAAEQTNDLALVGRAFAADICLFWS